MSGERKKRIIFSGYPCPAAPWKRFIPQDADNVFVTFSDVLREVKRPDFKAMAKFALKRIVEFQPSSILCHDYAVPYTLLALLYAKKKAINLDSCLTIFNGAFRGFDVFRAPHPFRSQWISWNRFINEVKEAGGEIDPEFERLNPLVRALYRRVILFNLREKLTGLFKKEAPLGLDLGIPTQIIASPSDRYVPVDIVRLLQSDFGISRLIEVDYGHFPYSRNEKESQRHLLDFEAMKQGVQP